MLARLPLIECGYACAAARRHTAAWLLTMSLLSAGLVAWPTVHANDDLMALGEACMVEVVSQPDALVVRYDVFAAAPVIHSVPLRVRNLAESTCLLRLERADGRATRFALADSGIQASIAVGHAAGGRGAWDGQRELVFHLAPGVTQRIEIGVQLEPGAFTPPGDYAEDIVLRLRDERTGELLFDELRTRVLIDVPARAQVNVAGTRGQYGTGIAVGIIDLGRLVTGLEREVYVQIRANDAYHVEVTSDNAGELRLAERPHLPGISYHVTLAGQAAQLVQPLTLQRPRPRTPAGDVLPLRIRLGDAEGRIAGRYRDTVHVTVQAM